MEKGRIDRLKIMRLDLLFCGWMGLRIEISCLTICALVTAKYIRLWLRWTYFLTWYTGSPDDGTLQADAIRDPPNHWNLSLFLLALCFCYRGAVDLRYTLIDGYRGDWVWLFVSRAGGFLLSARVPRLREGYYNSVRSLFNKIFLGKYDVISLWVWELHSW
jgi:hypothetical protein